MIQTTANMIHVPTSSYQDDFLPFDKRKSDKRMKTKYLFRIKIRLLLWSLESNWKYNFTATECGGEHDPVPWKLKRRNTVPNECFDRCKLNAQGKAKRWTLFASLYPVSEYMDNVSRIGHVIMNSNFHCHKKCRRTGCTHPFVVDLDKNLFGKRKCIN